MNCFILPGIPGFKMGASIDFKQFPVELWPFYDNDEPFKSILEYSKGYSWPGFDGGLSALTFTIDNKSQKLNSMVLMWTLFNDPEVVFEDLRSRILPCIPSDKLLANPDVTFKDDSSEYPGFYKHVTSHDGPSGLYYWVNIDF